MNRAVRISIHSGFRKKRHLIRFLTLALLLSVLTGSAVAGEWTDDVIPATPGVRHAPSLRYYVYTPEELKPGLPLVVYLHTSEGIKHTALNDILPVYIADGTVADPQAVILVPQLTRDLRLYWSSAIVSVNAVVEKVMADYDVDVSRISLTGASLGGNGIWDLAVLAPGRYARLLCIGGWVSAGVAAGSFTECEEIRVFSAKDKMGNPKNSENFVNALKEAGVNASYELLNMEHFDAPKMLYADKEIQQWLWLIPGEDASETPEPVAEITPAAETP